MSIEKKSLISNMTATKKALIATTPAAGSAAPTVVKTGIRRALGKQLATKRLLGMKLGTRKSLGMKLARKK